MASAGAEKSRPRVDPLTTPKEIMTVLYKPGHRLFQLAFTAEVNETPLTKLWGLLGKRGIRIISSTLSDTGRTGGKWNVFLDCEDYSITKEALAHMLENLPYLGGLRIAGGSDLIVDDLYFPIVSTTGSRTMLISLEVLQRMLAAMGEQFGSGGTVISYQEGVAMGAIAAAALQVTMKGDVRRFITEAVKLYSANGIGQAQFVTTDFDSPHFVVRISRNIECEGKHSKKPNSEWIRGHISGSASLVLGFPMVCTETKCIAMGDPYCEFDLTKSDA